MNGTMFNAISRGNDFRLTFLVACAMLEELRFPMHNYSQRKQKQVIRVVLHIIIRTLNLNYNKLNHFHFKKKKKALKIN